MPCFTVVRPGITVEQRKSQVKLALERLEAALTARKTKLVIGPTGAIAVKDWDSKDRDDVTDVCAVRALLSQNSWAFRQALAAAEMQAGRKANMQQVAAGVHSHDSGQTWHKGH